MNSQIISQHLCWSSSVEYLWGNNIWSVGFSKDPCAKFSQNPLYLNRFIYILTKVMYDSNYCEISTIVSYTAFDADRNIFGDNNTN